MLMQRRGRWIARNQASTANSKERQISPQKGRKEKRQETPSQSLCWRRYGLYLRTMCSWLDLRFLSVFTKRIPFQQQENVSDPKTKKRSEKVTAGSGSGKKTKPGGTGRGRSDGSRRGLIHAEKGERWLCKMFWISMQSLTCNGIS